MKMTDQKSKVTADNHKELRLTHAFKNKLESKVKRLYINKEFVDFVNVTINKLPIKDKLSALHFFRKLAIQTLRQPDPQHYNAFKDEYDEELSALANEQKHYDPVRFIDSEIKYIINSAERLTAEDVNKRLDIMQEAKERLSKPWLTKGEVMELFDISKSTLNRRIAEGMPSHKKGKGVCFYLDELNEWMRSEAA
jgi:excisionase family DNA binding protein